MKEKHLSVWKDGEHWFDFPEVNEQNVMDMLMKKDISQKCIILPMGESPYQIKAIEIKEVQTKTTKPTNTTKK